MRSELRGSEDMGSETSGQSDVSTKAVLSEKRSDSVKKKTTYEEPFIVG